MRILVVDETGDRRRLLRIWAESVRASYGLSLELVFAENVNHAQTLLDQAVDRPYGAIVIRDVATGQDFADTTTFIGYAKASDFSGPIIGISAYEGRLGLMIDSGCTDIVQDLGANNQLTELVEALTRPTRDLMPA